MAENLEDTRSISKTDPIPPPRPAVNETRLWVVVGGDYDQEEWFGIFSTEALAEAAADQIRASDPHGVLVQEVEQYQSVADCLAIYAWSHRDRSS